MNNDNEQSRWWELHLRHARGETLSETEQEQYAAELARHDREADMAGNLESLKQLRAELAKCTQENARLKSRKESLQQAIQIAERNLDPLM